MNKTKILVLVILFLLVTNMVTIISGLRYSRIEKGVEDPGVEVNERASFFGGQLGLTDEQRAVFMTINRTFNQEARRTATKIGTLRFQMIDELAERQPDMEKTDSICSAIGELHRQLKVSTSDYYINIKAICNEEQQQMLHGLFREIADPDADPANFGRGRGMQKNMGGRRGPGWQQNRQNSNQ